MARSADLQNAYCSGNTNAAAAPSTTAPQQPPVANGQPAILLNPAFPTWPAGNYLSCFPFNTIYTIDPGAGNNNLTNCTMRIRRNFMVCSDTPKQVFFNLNILSDDGVNLVTVDAGSGGAVNLFAGPPVPALGAPITVNGAVTLAPGLHTLDIVSSDFEDHNGAYFTFTPVNGTQNPPQITRQWNPFGVSVTGNITTAGNSLLNAPGLSVTPITGPASLCAGASITLTNATPGGTWSSSNTNVATVTPTTGIVTGIAPGTAVITYSIGQGNCTTSTTYTITVTNCHCEDSCNWSLTGNSNVKPWNFIGPLNAADFKIRTANTQRMVVTATGDVGINTTSPAKLLDVNGEARVASLPAAVPNDRIVFADNAGDLRSLATTGNTNQYLSGDGTWQTLTGGGGSVTGADQGCTLFRDVVVLGDRCNAGGGLFQQSREVNMNNLNLYFNSFEEGKLFMGDTRTGIEDCRQLYTRLEISSAGIRGAGNDYNSPNPSTSGLRFTNLTAQDKPIPNESDGVLSLDKDGDVIWVQKCCTGGVAQKDLESILDRLTRLENEIREAKAQNNSMKEQLAQMDIVLSKTNTVVLNQNMPNPFAESTVITYALPQNFSKAQIIFSTTSGK